MTFDTVERIDAPLGGAFLIPLDPAMLRDANAPPRVLLDDGLELPTSLHAVTLHTLDDSPTDSWSNWLGPTHSWRSRPITFDDAKELSRRADAGGMGFALLVEPKNGRSDSACWLLDQRVPMQWLASIDTLALVAPSVKTGPWGPTLPPEASSCEPLRRLVERERANPITRWRARLLEDGLHPGVSSEPYEDSVLEALAAQTEHRVRVALARLWMASPDLCERVKKRLSAVTVVGDGVGVPMWETNPQTIDRLLFDLLNAHFSASRRVQLAEQWLAAQPPAAAWVLDDAGMVSLTAPDQPTRALASVALVNLGERSRLAWVGASTSGAPSDLRPIDPFRASVQLVGVTTRGRKPLEQTNPLLQRAWIGEWSQQLRLLPAPWRVTPPGLRTSLFQLDHNLPTLLAGAAPLPDEQWSTAAMLHKPAPSGSSGAVPGRLEWELYVECRTPARPESDNRECVSVLVGPREEPTAAWRITPDGRVRPTRELDQSVAEELGEPILSASVSRGADRWSLRVALPPGAIEEGGLVRLSLIREDSRGVRQTWPRAMTPWAAHPSRALLDLSAWEAPLESEPSEP